MNQSISQLRISYSSILCFVFFLCVIGVQRTRIQAERPPNVLLICVDDLRPELKCYGASYIHSPNIDALADKSRLFTKHYVQAPTCGASRYALLTGLYPKSGGNNALFARASRLAKKPDSVSPSMPAWFRKHGYTTVSVGKVSHHPGGRGGDRWNSDGTIEMPNSWDRHLLPAGPWQDPRGWMHGLANGEIRNDKQKLGGGVEMDVFQSKDGGDEIYPDGLSINESLRQMELLATDDKPFFLAVGILRPHLPFGAPAKYMEPYRDAVLPSTPHPKKPSGRTTWHGSGEFMKYDRFGKNPNKDPEFAIEVRKHYAACVSYADAQVGRLISKLNEVGMNDNTIIVLWGDHGWHLGEHSVWGKHTLFEESLRSPLLVSYPGMPNPGQASDSIVETLDIFPTLCELAGLPEPKFVTGQTLKPILKDASSQGHTAIAIRGANTTIRTMSHRAILHKGGHIELYNHKSPAKESVNIADQNPSLAKELVAEMKRRLSL